MQCGGCGPRGQRRSFRTQTSEAFFVSSEALGEPIEEEGVGALKAPLLRLKYSKLYAARMHMNGNCAIAGTDWRAAPIFLRLAAK